MPQLHENIHYNPMMHYPDNFYIYQSKMIYTALLSESYGLMIADEIHSLSASLSHYIEY
jgi:hypothetical protein